MSTLPTLAEAVDRRADNFLPQLRWPGGLDYSYGIFLYGFPAQQAVMAVWPSLSPLALCVASTALVLPFALGSWHLIERPLLRWGTSRRTERAVADRASGVEGS